uniref:Uncharacterized protein n=1 Tax=Setaria italica TaxID=4555 RepID=K3YEY8_SETIT
MRAGSAAAVVGTSVELLDIPSLRLRMCCARDTTTPRHPQSQCHQVVLLSHVSLRDPSGEEEDEERSAPVLWPPVGRWRAAIRQSLPMRRTTFSLISAVPCVHCAVQGDL